MIRGTRAPSARGALFGTASARGTYSRYSRSPRRPFWKAASLGSFLSAAAIAPAPPSAILSASVINAPRRRTSAPTAPPRRQQHPRPLHVPHASGREPDVGQEVGGQEEEREDRLVMRIAARHHDLAELVLPARRVAERAARHDSTERKRELERDAVAPGHDDTAVEVEQAVHRAGHRRRVAPDHDRLQHRRARARPG